MPRVSSGTKAAVAAALLAVSGPATPSMAPRPKRDGVLETLRSNVYEAIDERVPLPPGSTPRPNPSTDPRRMDQRDSRMSERDGQTLLKGNAVNVCRVRWSSA